jgi:hypothetical protein
MRASLSILLLLAASGGALADEPAPAAAVWSYDDLGAVLRRYVGPDGLVDYDGLAQDAEPLERFVDALARTSPDSAAGLFPGREDRLAYWINAYNALMLRRVVRAWPVASVREIKPLYGVFWMEHHVLGGRRLTLRGLENGVIRERFDEPRIHFAINCASAGCPALRNAAWRPESLEEDLEAAARRFIRDHRNVRFDRDGTLAHLSRIFDWYEKDFTRWLDARGIPHPHGVLDYVVRFLSPEDREGLDLDGIRVQWIEYDWSINARGGIPTGEPHEEPDDR